ncbi:hypothetical protein F8154_01980 [Alkaliphilus pronyensis]|uniref:HEPN AbiU2-like domain-containing protein n=1 Tax=Alkaliphilus pronyensis TaxID=1482732 RepID=A0A6I0FC21_9FIRM|nr:hypothetical protein [Alkaliphilus pronyensis]KAB3537892.1 hypothetical protein F8154_01980 [Alkaliphilus pronyensis]
MKKDKFYEYQVESMNEFYMHFRAYRMVHIQLENLKSNTLFWTIFSNTSIKNLFIYWCRIFGNKNVNMTHWQHHLREDEIEEFRNILLSTLEMTMDEWKKYHSEMLEFRNSYVAHHDKNHRQPVPVLDKAVLLMQTYEKWIKDKLVNEGIMYIDDLYEYVNPYISELKNIINKDL